MGIMHWLHGTLGLNPLSYLPAAFAYVGAKSNRTRGLYGYIWTTEYWAQIVGWLSTFGYFYVYYILGSKYWYITTLGVLFDFFGWPIFYIFKNKSLRYARYQIAKQERALG